MSSAPKRATTKLSSKLERILLGYAAAASAAGVGILAMAPRSQAEIVFTPTHTSISGGTLSIDLNNDGITDVTIGFDAYAAKHRPRRAPYGTTFGSFIGISAVSHNRFVANGKTWASAMPFGQKIGRGDTFEGGRGEVLRAGGGSTFSQFWCTSSGPWAGDSYHFLGVAFMIDGQVHYGWARLRASGTCMIREVTLSGYAYETEPAKAIRAGQTTGDDELSDDANPQPGTLGSLALGAGSRTH
jgi:hypothetical protein